MKFREEFRPFAPVVVEEMAHLYFEHCVRSQFMMFTYPVKPDARNLIPGAVHADGTARVQTVSSSDDQFLWSLLHEFESWSGIPVLINTSLNLRGHPIVRTPLEALQTLCSSSIDILYLENVLIARSEIAQNIVRQLTVYPADD